MNSLNYFKELSLKDFIFKYLKPIDILNKDKIQTSIGSNININKINSKIYNNNSNFFKKLNKTKSVINSFINIIDEKSLNHEIYKDIPRQVIKININNKRVYDGYTNKNLSLMTEEALINILNIKLNNEITKDKRIIKLIKNTLFQVITSLYWPFITKDTLFKEYPFLKNNNINNQTFFKTINHSCNINIIKLNNKITQIINYNCDLEFTYDISENLKFIFGKAETKILIDYTKDLVNIEAKSIIFNKYKIIFDIIKNDPNFPKKILDKLFNNKILDENEVLNKNKVLDNIELMNIIKLLFNKNNIKLDEKEKYLNILIDYNNDIINIPRKKIISDVYKILFYILSNNPDLSKNTLDLLFDNVVLNKIELMKKINLLFLIKTNNINLDKKEKYLNILINKELVYELILLDTDQQIEILQKFFDKKYYTINQIDNMNNLINIYEIKINDECKIADIIIFNNDNSSVFFIKWNDSLKLSDNCCVFIEKEENKLKKQELKNLTRKELIISLFKSVNRNENNRYFLFFFINLIIFFVINNIYEDIFLKYILLNNTDILDIINNDIDFKDVNYYTKISLLFSNLYEFINNTIYNKINWKKEQVISNYLHNNKDFLNDNLKRILYDYSMKPINNNYISLKSDVLIISYNEGNKTFNLNDCISMIFKIKIEEPSVIILCSQESSSNKSYQDIFIDVVSKSYTVIKEIKASDYVKNVKTTLFIKNKSFAYEETFLKENKLLNSFEGKTNMNKNKIKEMNIFYNSLTKFTYDKIKYKEKKKNNEDLVYKFYIKNISYKKMDVNIVNKIFGGKLFKGSLFLELIIEKTRKEYKFIIINSHLYYKEDGNTGLQERTNEFFTIINYFKLPYFFENEYNIFFCGDLNFRLFSIKNNAINYEKESRKIINNYLKNDYKVFFEKYMKSNELTQSIINYEGKENKVDKFIKNIYKSIETTGFSLTCKYEEIDNLNYKEKINNTLSNKNFIIEKHHIPRIPSMCDRILYSTNKDLTLNYNNFNMYSIPKKSDHKIITLSFELESEKSNGSTNLNQLEKNYSNYNLNQIAPSMKIINDIELNNERVPLSNLNLNKRQKFQSDIQSEINEYLLKYK